MACSELSLKCTLGSVCAFMVATMVAYRAANMATFGKVLMNFFVTLYDLLLPVVVGASLTFFYLISTLIVEIRIQQ